jgi:hypothetical protein
MSLLKRAADFAYTLRFLRLLTTPFIKMKAFELGIIDENGKRDRDVKLDSFEKKDAYTYFIRIVVNIKKLIGKVTGGDRLIGNLAAGLFLIKENYGVNEKDINKILKKYNIESLDFLSENTEWFVSKDKMLTPGVYKMLNSSIVNSTCEELVRKSDKIRVHMDSYPVGDMFGLDVYEATHMNTNQKLYITLKEISR